MADWIEERRQRREEAEQQEIKAQLQGEMIWSRAPGFWQAILEQVQKDVERLREVEFGGAPGAIVYRENDDGNRIRVEKHYASSSVLLCEFELRVPRIRFVHIPDRIPVEWQWVSMSTLRARQFEFACDREDVVYLRRPLESITHSVEGERPPPPSTEEVSRILLEPLLSL